MKIGICGSVSGLEKIDPTAIDYVEEHVRAFLVPQESEERFSENLKSVRNAAVPVEAANCFLPGDLKCVGPDVDSEKLIRYATTAFRRAKQAGIEIIVFGSGRSRHVPDGFPTSKAEQQFVDLLKLLAPIAEENGVTIVVEPLNKRECNIITSLAEGAEAVKSCNHPNVRLLADVYHMLRDGEGPQEIVRFGGLLRHAHIAEPDKRAAPGVTDFDFRPYLSAFRQAGYDRRMSIECSWGDIKTELPVAVDILRAQLG